MRRPLYALVAVLVFAFLTSAESCSETSSDGGGDEAADEGDGGGDGGGDGDCKNEATDDCTPHVGPNGSVRVDALVWRVTGASTADTIGDQTYGLGEKANGKFLIVNLKVTSKKDESATLSDDSIQLEAAGNSYSTDSDGTVAAMGEGEDPLFFQDISPDATLESKIVFDIPPNVLNKKIEVRFNELGFGETHGYIRLPTPTPG